MSMWMKRLSASWLASETRHPLSPYIPLQEGKQIDGGTYRPVQWFFDNLLPEEKARELLAKDVKVPIEDAFGLLNVTAREHNPADLNTSAFLDSQ